jgi:cytochrome c nitrite reductase small subunit
MTSGRRPAIFFPMRRWLAGASVSALTLAILAGALLGAGGYTVSTSEATSYFKDDPKACINCHIMREQFDGWQKASHHGLATCNDCHMPSGFLNKYWTKSENGYWHSKGFTLQDFHEPIQIRPRNAAIVRDNCLRCHGAFMSGVAHASDPEAQRLDCVRCHGQVGHGPTR